MHNKFCIIFFQTIKCCCQVHVQATSLLKRSKHWNAFRVWLYEKQLSSLGEISHSPRCWWYVKSFIFILCLYDLGGWRPYRDLNFRSKMGWTKFIINTSGSLSRRQSCKCICVMPQFVIAVPICNKVCPIL